MAWLQGPADVCLAWRLIAEPAPVQYRRMRRMLAGRRSRCSSWIRRDVRVLQESCWIHRTERSVRPSGESRSGTGAMLFYPKSHALHPTMLPFMHRPSGHAGRWNPKVESRASVPCSRGMIRNGTQPNQLALCSMMGAYCSTSMLMPAPASGATSGTRSVCAV